MNFDIQEIPLPDGSIDLIVCSHVLEHVPDDRRATRELVRILRHDARRAARTLLAGRPSAALRHGRRSAERGSAEPAQQVAVLDHAGLDVGAAEMRLDGLDDLEAVG